MNQANQIPIDFISNFPACRRPLVLHMGNMMSILWYLICAVYFPGENDVTELFQLVVLPSEDFLCERCRLYTSDKKGELCQRCDETVLAGWDRWSPYFIICMPMFATMQSCDL